MNKKTIHIVENTFLNTLFDKDMVEYIQSYCQYYLCFQYNLGEKVDCEKFCLNLNHNVKSYVKDKEF